jgi:hypothetical protein
LSIYLKGTSRSAVRLEAARRRAMAKRSKRDEYTCHSLEISRHAVGYAVHAGKDGGPDEYFNFDLQVELEDSPKGVLTGSIILYGKSDGCGGTIHYDSDKELHGCLWIGLNGAVALTALLAAGKVPKLMLWGSPFFRRSAQIRDISWYTPGHYELEE